MIDLTHRTMPAVVEDMLGFRLFGGLVTAVVSVTALYLDVLFRDRCVGWQVS